MFSGKKLAITNFFDGTSFEVIKGFSIPSSTSGKTKLVEYLSLLSNTLKVILLPSKQG
jgi:hypothetical protein